MQDSASTDVVKQGTEKQATVKQGTVKRDRKPLNTLDAVAMTIGTMVGAGIFTILGLTVKIAGPASVFAWVLIVILSLPMAYTFSDLIGTLSQSGGPYVYLRDRTRPWIGLWTAWSFLLSSFGAAVALFIALIGMIQQLKVPHATGFAIAILVIVTGVVSAGIHVGARVQRIMTTGTVALLALCIVVGLCHARWLPGHPLPAPAMAGHIQGQPFLTAMFPHGWKSVLPATFFAFWTYSGWEAVAVPSEAYRDRRGLARGMMIGSLVVGALYVLVALAAVASVPAEVLAHPVNPLVLVGELWGSWFGQVVAWGAVCIVVASVLSWLITSATLLQSVVRDGLLPGPKAVQAFQGEYHPALPAIVAITLVICASLPIFAGAIAASSLTALIGYAVVFAVVTFDRHASWKGVFKTPARRRTTAGLALCTTILLIVFSGWANIWPTIVLLVIGGAILYSRQKPK